MEPTCPVICLPAAKLIYKKKPLTSGFFYLISSSFSSSVHGLKFKSSNFLFRSSMEEDLLILSPLKNKKYYITLGSIILNNSKIKSKSQGSKTP